MENPFDDDNAEYVVLVNDARQHSLWPATMTVPGGWSRVFGPAERAECLDHVERNWTDIRPVRARA
ncbi:MbtH family protein [Saccharothrix australiensis]|uniref:MbtH protein n=1 Tax=Saccharothrix australiensis TaxID=2072 RepID=A0A495VZQ3_9PSEU|nr:MbtH family protein [Saccharothrix australiensis]RKT54237.1 MbtH protein [Saccharothrix australiensis]